MEVSPRKVREGDRYSYECVPSEDDGRAEDIGGGIVVIYEVG